MEHCDRIAEFIVVARPSDHDAIQKTIADLQLKKCSAIVPGGATRQESVLNGVRAASKAETIFAIMSKYMVKCLQNNYFRQFSAACCYLLYRASVPPKKPARSKSVPALYTI